MMRAVLVVLVGIIVGCLCQPTPCPGGKSSTSCSNSYCVSTQVMSGTLRDVWGCGDQSLQGSDSIRQPQQPCGTLTSSPNPPCKGVANGYKCAQDFERRIIDDRRLMLFNLNTQDPDRPPVFNTSALGQTVINQTQVNWWYKDADSYSMPFALNMTMSNYKTCNDQIYDYTNNTFYPLDGIGLGNYYNNHNYHFTFAAHTRFNYIGFEKFSFLGDDDLFIYINGRLALDLGGVHGAESGQIDLTWPSAGCTQYTNPPKMACSGQGAVPGNVPCACILGITKNNNYPFDMFYNERHTVASEIQFETSLKLNCLFYDWCGVCQGNGQSCCTCQPTGVCHTATCNVTTGACIDGLVECPAPSDACHTSFCNTANGNCATGLVNCNGTSKCINYGCNPSAGCTQSVKSCDDSNPCTTDTCDPSTGCSNVPLNCDDGSVCTTDSCSGGVCSNVNKPCNAGNKCTNNTCDPIKGCTYASLLPTCLTGNLCFNQGCDNSTGCFSNPVNCNDNNLCTSDSCSSTLGCQNVNTTSACLLHGTDKCWVEGCSPTSGCFSAPKNCDDKDPCTIDGCDPLTGCTHINTSCSKCFNVSCPNTGACAPTTCDPATGTCNQTFFNCNDGNPCTADSCSVGTDNQAKCANVPNPCNNTNLCLPQTCSTTTGLCVTNAVTCNDNNLCTNDSCVVIGGQAQCQFIPVVCASPDACNPASCVSGSCVHQPVVCNDDDLCTNDSCIVSGSAASCQYVAKTYATTACQTAVCNPMTGAWNVTDITFTCNDGNACTLDSCDPISGCVHVQKNCNDSNACTADSCNSTTGCVNVGIVCDDSSVCTNDTCDTTHGCVFTESALPNGTACVQYACDSRAGVLVSVTPCPDSCSGCDPLNGCVGCSAGSFITPTTIGIGAGVLAAIIIAAVVAAALLVLGGKKGYDYYMSKQADMGAAANNPLYNAGNRAGTNPLYA